MIKLADLTEDPLNQLPINAMKEQFSLGFVRMVAAAAGCSVKDHATDYDGVDITVASSAQYDRFYAPQFELQVKCTNRPDLVREAHVNWSMEAGPFQKLTNPTRYLPAYLGVLVIPVGAGPWLEQDETQLLSRSRMYWQAANQLGTLADGAGSITVRLPRQNTFDVPQLKSIMELLGNGGDW
ncbi:DUF4365 domain-containing protein [Streptomyces sp. NPDC005859]|uniref:DUF4365 domain-containing protein n=1 Tax=Streptomyces sp. NPDC005859 TaxID=3157170 RepID=UPI0033CD71FA